MPVKIAHLSDIHWERCDANVSDRLGAALKRESPDLLIFTGDLVDNPWSLKHAKPFLIGLCETCGLDPQTRLLVVPGNHDYKILGTAGWRPLSGWLFYRHQFRDWLAKKVRIFKDLNVSFFLFDSNPLIWGLARGRIGWREFRKVGKEWDALPKSDREAVENSVRIALVHHHVLPIPYAGSDRFLVLQDAQRLLQFLAEKRISMVLHGHKHHAAYSLLCLRSSIVGDRLLEVLGAGAAVLGGTDHDARGHNFNLICIEDNGLRYVRQFFAQPGEAFCELPDAGYPTQSFELAYQRALKIGYSCRTIRWSLDIDVEGDRFNEIAYTDVAANPDVDLPSLQPPSYVVETGHLSPVWLKAEQSGPLASLRPIKNEARRVEFAVDFARTPTQADPASFTLESYDYNASSLDAVEFRRKFPKRAILREWEEKSIEEPVDDFAWTLRFPRELRFERPPEFEVVDTRTAERHEWLTRVLTPSFYYSEPLHTAILAIHRPPAGYLYRIYWYIAARGPTEPAIDPKHQLQADGFRKKLLAINEAILDHQTPPPIHAEVRRVLQAFAKCVEEKIAHLAGTASYLQARDLDVSLMVYDKYRGDDVPVLRIVSCIGPEAHRHWPFTLEVGDGNAGRAFKKNIIRSWDALSSDPHQTYIHQAGLPPHSIIYSIPMRHPPPVSQDLIYGILNLGAHTPTPAGPLRLLNDKAGIEWLTDTAQEYVLKRLLDIV